VRKRNNNRTSPDENNDIKDWLLIGGLTLGSSAALLGWLISGAFFV
jgi:hypothetical protein